MLRYAKVLLVAGAIIALLNGCGTGGGGTNGTTGNQGGTTDTTRPTVSQTSPANGATGVAINSAVSLTFSEAVDPSSVTSSTFQVAGVSGTVSLNGTTATFTPSSNLSNNTTYNVTLTTGIKDAAGNTMAANYTCSFTTGAQTDTTPPTVSSVNPADNATGTAVNAAVTATFSETMDASTITTSTFTLKQGTTPVSGTVTYNGTTATFTPSNSLSYSTTYTATITTGVKDGAGNAMVSNYAWSFTTGATTDTTPPTVSSTSPADNATGVAINGSITATFSETMDASTISTTTFTLKQGTTPVSGTVTYSGTTATFTPSFNLSYSTTYTATITTGVKDAAGNAMASNYTWSFNSTVMMGGSIQGNPLNLTNTVTTIAGAVGLSSSTDGIGMGARFNYPWGITTDGTNLFVVDRDSNTIRRIVISSGEVTTVAGTSGLSGSTDGTGASARFLFPQGITTDGTNLFVADTGNNTIRKIAISTGVVSTIAGSPGLAGLTDGIGSAARLYGTTGITTDGTNLFVADTGNNAIRKIIISTGEVTTLAGSPSGTSGSTDGIGATARFYVPFGITTDGTNLFVSDTYNEIIRKIIISTGEVTTLAGSAGLSGSTDGIGSLARFGYPYGITTDGANLFIADGWNNIIRKIVVSTGTVTTIAGEAAISGSADGISSSARLNYPRGITTDGINLFITDTNNFTIRKIQ